MLHTTKPKVALVHDYLREYGGAERVLRTLADMYPDASVHVAFKIKGSTGDKEFSDRVVKESFLAPLLKLWKLYSPLRFLTPLVWRSFDFREYDLVITSASWYITRGFRVGPNTKVICYCHTPPRWLYGLQTSGDYQKYWPVKVYAKVVGWFMRKYDKWTVKRIDLWIANSENVKKRIKKYYSVDSTVVYPPIEVEDIIKATKRYKKKGYFFIASRLTGGKGLEETVRAANKSGFKLKIAGEAADVSSQKEKLEKMKGSVELVGRPTDARLYQYYSEALGFFALAADEDFGMTVPEAQAAGTPVIALDSGGFKESVVDNQTGFLIKDTEAKTISAAVNKLKKKKWDRAKLQENSRRFSSEKFEGQINHIVRTMISTP